MDQGLLTVEETVTHEDGNSDRLYPFTVPEGATALRLSFTVDPQGSGPYDHCIGVHLHDPHGSRGTPGYAATVPPRIGPSGATPGLVPGPLPPGTWNAEVGITYVVEGPPCNFRLSIWLEDAVDAEPPPSPKALPAVVAGTRPGWYAGDLHLHSQHSDGRWSIPDLWRAVQARQLDFFVLTDHNSVTGHADLASLEMGKVLPIPGIEVSMRSGHLLALGTETLIDWRVGQNGRTIHDVLQDVHAAGGLAIIAHPGADPSPICHGCRWDLPDVDPREIDAVEVWNSRWLLDEDNERSLLFYDRWLTAGFRVPISGGSDEHGHKPLFGHDVPTTHVYARELSREAILDGIRAGHTVVSSGPLLRVNVTSGDVTAMPGDAVAAIGPLVIEATVSAVPEGGRLTILRNGAVLAETIVQAEGACRYASNQAEPGWYRADLRSLDGSEMLAIASPFFVGDSQHNSQAIP